MIGLEERVASYARLRRRRIAIGMDSRLAPPEDLEEAAGAVELICVGDGPASLPIIRCDNPSSRLVDLLIDGEVDGVVRGQVDHTRFMDHALSRQGLTWSEVHLVSLLRWSTYAIWLAPASNTEGWTRRDKERLVSKMMKLLRAIGEPPRIGLISGVRPGDVGHQWFFDSSYFDAEDIVRDFEPRVKPPGWVRHFNIESERAIAEHANALILPNGMTGNQCYRLLVYTGLAFCVTNLTLGLRLNVVGCSRNERHVGRYVRWAAAVANGLVESSEL